MEKILEVGMLSHSAEIRIRVQIPSTYRKTGCDCVHLEPQHCGGQRWEDYRSLLAFSIVPGLVGDFFKGIKWEVIGQGT